MSITIQEIQEIKAKAEQKQRALERAKGNREQLLKELKRKFDCDSVTGAEKLMEEMRQKGETLVAKIEKLKARVVESWNEIESAE